MADDGTLVGTRLWRVRAGYVEYFALRPHGFAHAVRVEADFDYRRPAQHGPVVEHRRGHAINALNWLLTDTEPGFAPYLYDGPELDSRASPTGWT
ncbi:hypothetical protein [Amycolatopsis rhizosphaerae]|uniref:hypothetical protein n=1 Tax=Amycolatopsis rhizosphaerae TaxID=2053003 RepID=UPI001FE67565|nr:hypothetical protein [Amycolatopsis rhizosphaerae]